MFSFAILTLWREEDSAHACRIAPPPPTVTCCFLLSPLSPVCRFSSSGRRNLGASKATEMDVRISRVEIGPLLSQCAESKVYECNFYGHRAVCKHRFSKAYRHPALDQRLREQRTVREGRALVRCRKNGVIAPTVYAVDRERCAIVMERIDGLTVREFLNQEQEKATHGQAADTVLASRLLRGMGEVVGLLHNADIIHGDLTTSNFICRREILDAQGPSVEELAPKPPYRDGIVVIDFGLVMDKNSAEERAVDLYVLERAVKSSHPFLEHVSTALILEGYLRTVEAQKGAATIARLEAVRARGRKRSMIG
ncbi:protein kinase [Trypanosoma conorhini]|uniref:non-specific serine/threonine protein kinase n=1 Tax=Trypanosoma conorhini TaxID=83891 RepID=A0A3R7LT29_9TRYP|nr:protein kinase [Trypanosoma conorhini]RNF20137.1 protein kinase [Trypanosoma conorhini]